MKWTKHEQVSAQIASWVLAYLDDDILATCIAHGARGWVTAAKLKQTGAVSGLADWLVLHKGLTGFLEIKTGTGTLRTAQRRTRDKILRAGGQFAVIHSLEEFVAQLRKWDVPILDKPRGDPAMPADTIEDLWA